jgi:heavy metal sensor kinase
VTIKSFRLRLTAWYVGFFSLLFILFALSFHGILARDMQDRLDETLSSEANTAVSLFLDEMDEMHGDPLKAAPEAVSEMRLGGGRVAVFARGRMLAASAPVSASEFEAIAAQAAAMPGPDAMLALPRMGHRGARAAAHRLSAGGQDYLILAVEPLDAIAGDLEAVRQALEIAVPLAIALAAIGGFLVATRSLRPLKSMAEQAHQITGSNLDARLKIGDAAEELAVLAASFNELLSRLDQSFEAMRRFVADASHELRTPLSVIRGEADVALSQERGAAEYRQSLAIVLDESRRISRLVDDLLNLARADSRHVRLEIEEFYLNDLLAECCRSVQSMAAAKGVEVECRAGDQDVTFRGDEELLRRMVMNLVENAIRYTPAGGRVSVALEVAGARVLVRIADTGVGIAPEMVPHVFDRFFRADPARSRQNGGFGLGLAIVKWIAESHQGAVELTSEVGSGSTFTVTLPR